MDFANVLRGFVVILWVLVVALLVLVIVRASRGLKVRSLSIVVLAVSIAAVIVTTVSAGLVYIRPEERGVVLSALAPQGYREEPLQPGLKWIIPYFESVVRYPISRQTYTMSIAPLEGAIEGDDSIAARTSDGQELLLDASVIYAIDPSEVVQLHIEWQDRYTDGVVRPVTRGVIRDAVSQYGVEEVVSSKRFDMTKMMEDALAKKLNENGLILVDFVLRNISFSPEYAASVEQKQIAEQLAQQAAFVVQQRRQEAEQARQVAQGQADSAVIRAQGNAEARLLEAEAEAKALLLLADAVRNNPDLITYEYIAKLAPNIQAMLLPNNSPFLFPLPTLTPEATAIPTPLPTP
jgi:prohibitin 1